MSQITSGKNLILYADDDTDDVEFVRESFNKYAHNVELVSFHNGLELLRYLKSNSKPVHPCLIMLDINMPIMNGKEALSHIRLLPDYNHVPIILFSTSTQPHDKVYAVKHNAGFITKPLSFRQMDLIVDELIEHCSDDVQKRISRHFQ